MIKLKIFVIKKVRSLRFRSVNLATRYLTGGDPNSLGIAKKNIKKHFSVVGFTEMYAESLFLMKKQFNLQLKTITIQKKTDNRPSKSSISPTIIEKLKKINKNDIALYEWAKKDFLYKLRSLTDQDQEASLVSHYN